MEHPTKRTAAGTAMWSGGVLALESNPTHSLQPVPRSLHGCGVPADGDFERHAWLDSPVQGGSGLCRLCRYVLPAGPFFPDTPKDPAAV